MDKLKLIFKIVMIKISLQIYINYSLYQINNNLRQ